MGYFKIVYQGFPLDLPVCEEGIVLRAVSGSFPGQTLGDSIGLNLKLTSPSFSSIHIMTRKMISPSG